MAMAPRGSEGYDFTPIITQPVFLVTSVLAVMGWFIAFISQIVAEAQLHNGFAAHSAVGVLWFAIFLQLAVIVGVFATLATDSVALHRFQISIFGAISLVFSVIGVNQGIFTNAPSLEAMSAGWLLLAIVDVLWLIYFTSEENSLTLHLFNTMGTGGLTGPGRNGYRSGRRGTNSHNLQNGISSGYGGGIEYAPPTNAPPSGSGFGGGLGGYDMKEAQMGAVENPILNTSQRSLGGGGGAAGSVNSTGQRNPVPNTPPTQAPQPLTNTSVQEEAVSPRTPLMESNNAAGGEGSEYRYRAKALYAYTASTDDPNEISFNKGEVLEILDKSGKWWQAKRADGTSGIAPSNYLQLA